MAAKSAEPLPSRIMTTQQACERLNIARQMLQQYVAGAGYVKPLADNQWDEAETTQGYIRFLRDSRSAKSEAQERAIDAKLVEQNLKNAERMGAVVPREDFEEFVDAIAAFFLTELGSLPSRHHQRDLVERRRLEKDCHGVLERASKHFKQLAVGLPAVRTIGGAVPGANAGRMGRAK